MRIMTAMSGLQEVSQDLIDATLLGARLATRNRRSAGQADQQILSEVATDIRDILEDEGLDTRGVETLLSEARRAIGEVLTGGDDAPLRLC
jgi:hypothetical protein